MLSIVLRRGIVLAATVLFAACSIAQVQTRATIQKPEQLRVKGGYCQINLDGTFDVMIGPKATMYTLALTIGPGPSWADSMHANKARYTDPGKYANEIVAVHLGKTAKEHSYLGLGTVTIAADGSSGTFALNDGSVEGTFNCVFGYPPVSP